jgi:tripartite-type tricarboxylate transporter receptor subunit TctC
LIDRLNAEARTVLALPEVRERLQALGADPSPTTTQELERIVAHEIWENRELARKADIRLE